MFLIYNFKHGSMLILNWIRTSLPKHFCNVNYPDFISKFLKNYLFKIARKLKLSIKFTDLQRILFSLFLTFLIRQIADYLTLSGIHGLTVNLYDTSRFS